MSDLLERLNDHSMSGETLIIEARDKIKSLEKKLDDTNTRIDSFLIEVESVRFKCDEMQAEPWMPRWKTWLRGA